MGVEKQRKKDEEFESAFTLRSQPFDIDESGITFFIFHFFFFTVYLVFFYIKDLHLLRNLVWSTCFFVEVIV